MLRFSFQPRSVELVGMIMKLAGIALVAIVVAGASECGGSSLFECYYDSECLDSEHCVDNQCTAQCSRDQDCPPGRFCGAYQREDDRNPIQVCLDPDETEEGCETDSECREVFDDENARCGIHDTCVLTPESQGNATSQNDAENQSNADNANTNANAEPNSYPVLIVEQLDEAADSIDDTDDGGGQINQSEDSSATKMLPVHIGAVVVRDNHGEAVGYGNTFAVEGPLEQPSMELAGFPLPSGMCVDAPEEAPYTSLGGPGGVAYIELLDEQNGPVDIDDQYQIQILANGAECPIGGVPDDEEFTFGTYRVHLCEVTASGGLPERDCSHDFDGPYTAYTDLEVTFSE